MVVPVHTATGRVNGTLLQHGQLKEQWAAPGRHNPCSLTLVLPYDEIS
jgi:hypothetical protein